MPLILPANTLSDSGYEIDNSGLFNDGQTQFLSDTLAGSTNAERRTFTWSAWVKRGSVTGAIQTLYSTGSGTDDHDYLAFTADEKLQVFTRDAGSTSGNCITNAVYRDHNAWYHIVMRIDTTQSTDTNRIRIYVNGVEQSLGTATYPSQNKNLLFNTAYNVSYIGATRTNTSSLYFDGYIAEVHNISGTSSAPTEFAETNDNGVWIPKEFSGSYGTNGYFLEFGGTSTGVGSGRFASDTSGNGSHWDTNNFSGQFQMTDTPTNNFMTMNPLSQYGITFSKGNLSVVGTNSSGYSVCTGGWEVPRYGKWYYEVEVDSFSGSNHEYIGIKRDDLTLSASAYDLHSSTCQWYQSTDGSNGSFRDESTTTATSTALRHSAGDILMVAIEMDSDKMWFGKNGTWYDDDATTDGDPANGTNQTCTPNNGYTWHFFNGGGNNSLTYLYNFGNPPFTISSGNADGNGYGNFEYAVPSGFYSLCTKNLGEFGGN